MRSLVVLVAATALASCVRPVEPTGSAFAREIAGGVAGPAQTCVSTFGNQSLRVIDSSTIAYGSGRTIYVNRLPGVCPGLRQNSTLIVDAQSGQYCRGDRIRSLEPYSIIPGPSCNLGTWTPYRMR